MPADAVIASLEHSFETCRCGAEPYRHWILDRVLPEDTAQAIVALPFAPPVITDTKGRRETHNATRMFFTVENRMRFAACAEVADAFQDTVIAHLIEATCGARLDGSLLRIEYCLDTDGFWLEPHTDIGAKLFSMLLYLSDAPLGEDWGTDIYDHDRCLVATSPARFNTAMMFVPATDTWHGFHKRPITGVRRSIIINYVKDEWRSRHELAFPDRPVH